MTCFCGRICSMLEPIVATIPPIAAKELSEYTPFIQAVLYNRSIATKAAAKEYLNRNYDTGLHDPLLLPGINKAVKRILGAIQKKEHIAIYGDYDADGVPATAILVNFLRKIGHENISMYIPHRSREGFGLNLDAVRLIADRGTALMITVDCGITDVEEVALCNELGIDVVITDHHEPPDVLPDALVIIDPKLDESKYPFSELCGAGIAFKLVQALIQKGDFDITDGWEKWLLDLVGLATLSDMVPLVDENRILAHWGMHVLRKTRRPGFKALCANARLRPEYMTETDITFMLTPRLNAASRMDHADRAYELLMASTEEDAMAAALILESLNNKRKGSVAAIMKTLYKKFEGEEIKSVIVVGNPHWNPGLAGLIAGKLSDTYSRPAFVWGREGDGVIKGSCRSDGSRNLVELMRACPEGTFLGLGGHTQAGGFSVGDKEIHLLEDVLLQAFTQTTVLEPSPEIVDVDIALSAITKTLYKDLDQLRPFGVGNPEPVVRVPNVTLSEVGTFGKDKNHLKITLQDEMNQVEAIEFFTTPAEYIEKGIPLEVGKIVTVIGNLEKDTYTKGQPIRLRIKNIIV